MCNEPQSNIHLKPLGTDLLRPYGKPTGGVLSLFCEQAKRSIDKVYSIKLESIFVNNTKVSVLNLYQSFSA